MGRAVLYAESARAYYYLAMPKDEKNMYFLFASSFACTLYESIVVRSEPILQ